MKDASKEFLMHYIEKHPYEEALDYDMYRIFQYYSTLEIKSDNDVIRAIEDFKNFWQENLPLVKCEKSNRLPLKNAVMQEINQITQTILDARSVPVEQFTNIVDILSPAKHSSILDVGSGKYPYSSIKLAEKNNIVTSIDRSFYLSNKSLERMKVKVVNAYFDNSTPVGNYDFVVGRFPCSAIEHIVETCTKSNKPYFIQLCQCNAPSLEKKTKFFWQRWQGLLTSLDPNIQFFHNYAFNIDATSQQVESVIKQIRSRRYMNSTPPLRPSYEAKRQFIVREPPTYSREEGMEK